MPALDESKTIVSKEIADAIDIPLDMTAQIPCDDHMSVSYGVSLLLYCDGLRCQQIHMNVRTILISNKTTKAEAKIAARRAGWNVGHKRATCPGCQ